MTSPRFERHTAAVLTRLQSTGLLCGDGRKPAGAGWQGAAGMSAFVSYLVLYPLGLTRNGPDAPLADMGTDPQLLYQVTSVGSDRRSAEAAADLAAAALLSGVDLGVSGASTIRVWQETSAGVTRDEDVNPPLFYAVDRYRIDTTA